MVNDYIVAILDVQSIYTLVVVTAWPRPDVTDNDIPMVALSVKACTKPATTKAIGHTAAFGVDNTHLSITTCLRI